MKLPRNFSNRRISVLIVGAGGNGSQMLYGMAKLHAALIALGHPSGFHVTLADPDLVSESNVARQLFSPADVGHAKAHVLVHRVNLFYGLDWDATTRKIGKPSAADSHHDLYIGCVDSAASRRAIHHTVHRQHEAWWLDLGNSERTGQVVLGLAGEGQRSRLIKGSQELRPPVVTELFPALMDPKQKEDLSPSCSVAESLGRQDLFINQAVSTLALNLLWTWFRHGEVAHSGYFLNLEAGRVSPIPADAETWKRIQGKRTRKKPTANKRRTPVRSRSRR